LRRNSVQGLFKDYWYNGQSDKHNLEEEEGRDESNKILKKRSKSVSINRAKTRKLSESNFNFDKSSKEQESVK
jgi:hypothetical protein